MTTDIEGYELPTQCIDDLTTPGQANDEAAEYWQTQLGFQPARADAIAEIAESGGWSREELGAMDDLDLARLCLWVMAGYARAERDEAGR